MRSVELFSGCGGLALGLSRAGFTHLRMAERDRHSVQNIEHNRGRGLEHIAHWPIQRGDVRDIDWRPYRGLASIVAGGPPCQPFSIGGRHRGHEDHRDMWPEAVRALREVQPEGFLFENVRGLAREAFADYVEWIRLSLASPSLVRDHGEDRAQHAVRIRAHVLENGPCYQVGFYKVNAADYGAAQKRMRVILMGIRADVGVEPSLPHPTHSRERLIWDQWVTGAYWKRHGIRRPLIGPTNAADARTVDVLRNLGAEPSSLPWRTVRDAIEGLGVPSAPSNLTNHIFQPGARSYPGHTGSPIDEPSKALKAGVHGVPGGENTIDLGNGNIRYYTVREAARLQGLPDDYEFVGSWTENMRQLGNAVPAELAEALARHLSRLLGEANAGARQAAQWLSARGHQDQSTGSYRRSATACGS